MIYILIAAGVFTGAFGLRRLVERTRKEHESTTGRWLILRRHHNHGFALNRASDRPGLVKGISICACILVGIMFAIVLMKKGKTGLKIGMALFAGGAFSNLYERLTKGYVVDYVSFRTPFAKARSVVYNLADFCIFAGGLLSVISEAKG